MSDKPVNEDAREVSEILDVVSEKVPRLIKELVGSLYSAEAAENMGKAVGVFYKELLAAGIKPEDALEMTKDYMNTVKNVTQGHMGK